MNHEINVDEIIKMILVMKKYDDVSCSILKKN
jgi:hypothetical protein